MTPEQYLHIDKRLSSRNQEQETNDLVNSPPKTPPLLFQSINFFSQASQNSSQGSESLEDIDLFHGAPKKLKRSVSLPRGNDNDKVDNYFASVIEDLKQKQMYNLDLSKPALIIVCHMSSTIFPFLKAIEIIGDIALVIPKGYQRKAAQKIIRQLKEEKIVDIQNFIDPSDKKAGEIKNMIIKDGLKILKKYVSNRKFIIIDIGGYFSKSFEQMISDIALKELRNNLLGIVEDTRNGHKKYMDIIEKLKVKSNLDSNQIYAMQRLYSVAGCELKGTEDYNVGKSIVDATQTILREDAETMLDRMEIIGVIGFGKIGKSIAQHLKQKNLKRIIVYDEDTLKQMEASSMGFEVVDRIFILSNSNLIFSATGNKCICAEDIFYMMDNIFIASCTSSDDEFDPSFYKCISSDNNEISIEHGNIQKLNTLGKRINLLDQGNAVNFVFGAINGPYVYSVQAGLIAAAINLLVEHNDTNPDELLLSNLSIKELPKEIMEIIAKRWLNCFDKCYRNPDFNSLNLSIFDCAANTDKELSNIDVYFKENGHALLENNEALKQIITGINQIITGNKENLLSIVDSLSQNIRSFLKRGLFSLLMMHITEFLIKKCTEYRDASNDNYITSEITLYLLKATAMLYVNASCKKEHVTSNSLEDFIIKMNVEIDDFYPKKSTLEEQKKLLKFLDLFVKSTLFLNNKNGMEFKGCVIQINNIAQILNNLKDKVHDKNRLKL